MKRKILLLAMMMIGLLSTEAKTEKQHTFLYGFASSFNDSTIYFVEIQLLENSWVDSKTGFLYGRDSYSYQLRDYLKAQGVKSPTCITGFAKSRKKAEEKYIKLRNKYLSKGTYNIKYISSSEFNYSTVEFKDEGTYSDSSMPVDNKKINRKMNRKIRR